MHLKDWCWALILWPTDKKSWLTRKDPDSGKDWIQKENGCQRKRRLESITNSMDMSLSKLRDMVKDREAWCTVVHGIAKSWTWLINWTTTQKMSWCLFLTPQIAADKASLSNTNSWSLLKLMSIGLVMPSNHLILCHPLLLLPSIIPSIRVFSNESVLHIRWPKYSFSIRTDFP